MNDKRIENLIKLGVSKENIETMLSKGATIEQIEDYCNNNINAEISAIIKEITEIVSSNMKDYSFFSVLDSEIAVNKKLNNDTFIAITNKLLEKNVLYKNIDLIFNTIIDKFHSTFTNAKDSYKESREDLLAKVLGKEMPYDITISDVDQKLKELEKPE